MSWSEQRRAAVAAIILIAVPGFVGFVIRQPWLFPSLGPTIYLQSENPYHASARFYNVLVGHLVAIAIGIVSSWIFGVSHWPPAAAGTVYPVHIAASAIALVSTMLAANLLRASHPPAASTTLLFSLGVFAPKALDVASLVGAVVVVATFGEFSRRRLSRMH